ncbi:c-type cytochrome [Geothrix sp.]|uniref:c-type cytochrome n=1 Tax=Geothrix sp. TaxID=1962974 RepID=UPI0025BC484F|nr:c-type cytochrome [Geothrix sp.]
MRRHAEVLGLLLLLVISAVSFIAWIIVHGVSARDQPTAVEALLARSLRHAAIPRSDRALVNPVPFNEAALEGGRMHWADHCALCHGNDGKGNTEIGRNLFPKAPDMTTSVTQNLSDGELFSIIKNGVRLTGMPAWGASSHAEDDQTWKLVHFIRHLPRTTADELDHMRSMNPTSPMKQRETKAEDDFLNGTDALSSAGESAPSTHRKEPR